MNIPIGWFVAIASILGGFIWLGGTWSQLWVPQEYVILLGGGLGALLAANKWRNLRNIGVAVGRVFGSPEASKTENLELLSLLYELLQRIKTDGPLSIDQDLSNPMGSPVFAKYPALLKRERLIEFISDYLRMTIDGTMTLSQLETVMEQEISVLEIELKEPAESIDTLADSMPAFGIVAAIVGVIHALSAIGVGTTATVIGAKMASALVGTLLGVFAAYAIFAPVGRSLMQRAESEERQFRAVKEVLIASFSNFSPMVATEYGRKVLYSDQRPSMLQLEKHIMDTSGGRLRG